MKKIINTIYVIAVLFFVSSCVTPFEPEGYEQLENILVIEGDINLAGNTDIIVSRSLKLGDIAKRNYVKGANVWIESESGTKYYGYQVSSGQEVKYSTGSLYLDYNKRYKLCVVTPEGKRYDSELVKPLIPPPVSSVEFLTDTVKKEVTFYVNTADPANNTHYYKWSYVEEWEFTAHKYANFEYNPLTFKMDEIPYEKNKYYCWNSDKSKSILIHSTTHLSEDKVYRMPLVSMGPLDLRISLLYSIEVTQQALSKESYLYWENLRKNSDQLGGIFSPQPSEMRGNIKCISDSTEVVLGYISAGFFRKKKFFASKSEIGLYWDDHSCEIIIPEKAMPIPIPWSTMHEDGYVVVSYNPTERESVWVLKECADCRTKGTKTKPLFWPTDHI